MPASINVFENSLREYLINMQSDSYNTCNKIKYKYNNLKVYMEPDKNSTPHFWVSVNISAVCYSIEPLVKVCGSLGHDERFVLAWASRTNIRGELKKHWLYILKSSNDANATEVSNIITGTGINKHEQER